jgi:uncharacterized protein (UPF0333 family)
MEENKTKFQIGDIMPIAITLVVAGIAIAFGLSVMEDVQGDLTANSNAYNATGDAIEGVAKLPEKLPLIVTVIVAALIIGILLRYMVMR